MKNEEVQLIWSFAMASIIGFSSLAQADLKEELVAYYLMDGMAYSHSITSNLDAIDYGGVTYRKKEPDLNFFLCTNFCPKG